MGWLPGRLRANAGKITVGVIAQFLKKAADVLGHASKLRNSIMHAHPCTDSQHRQRLYRWSPSKNEFFLADDAKLDETIANLDALLAELAGCRVPYTTCP